MVNNGIDKRVSDFFSFLDNNLLRNGIIVFLVLYDAGIFQPINIVLSLIIKNTIVQLLLIILIVAVSKKNMLIALLLTIMLVTSVSNHEHFESYEDFESYSPLGYNSNTDCTNINEEDLCEVGQCTGIKTFENEIGAQGLSKPVGFNRDAYSEF